MKEVIHEIVSPQGEFLYTPDEVLRDPTLDKFIAEPITLSLPKFLAEIVALQGKIRNERQLPEYKSLSPSIKEEVDIGAGVEFASQYGLFGIVTVLRDQVRNKFRNEMNDNIENSSPKDEEESQEREKRILSYFEIGATIIDSWSENTKRKALKQATATTINQLQEENHPSQREIKRLEEIERKLSLVV